MKINDLKIFQKDWWTKWKILSVVGFIAVFIPLSIVHGSKQRVWTDFHIFWTAGKSFFNGLPLYDPPEGGQFLYPPFAAFLFQAFAPFPLKIAAGLFYFFNALLYVTAVYLTKVIIEHLYPGNDSIKKPLIFAVILSAQFYFMNMNAGQVNLVVFVLCLAGIYLYLKGKGAFAGVFFVIPAFIKVTPAFLIVWILLRNGKKVILPVIISAVLCLILPVMLRGIEPGIQDMADYYHKIVRPFKGGKVDTSFQNQNVAGTIYRMTRPSTNTQNYNYRYIPLSEETAAAVYKSSVLLIFALFTANLIFLRIKHAGISALEISSVFLTGHLLSALTWKAHLVTLLFVFTAFFAIDRKTFAIQYKAVLYFLFCMILFIGSTGKDIVGAKLHFYIGGFSITAWTLLLLFLFSIRFSAGLPLPEKNRELKAHN
ncbi:hypothetical protein AMJ80_01715 [bacterium SM23_31]|nr:MAG: hypothetical protein AMJ80_01715 [bacterium SM23_31]